jgi:hypothetical protein
MQSDRSFILRRQSFINLEWLSYPYFYLNEYDLTPESIIGEPKQDPIDFPSCITNYYWIYEGINDEVPWRALFEYKNKDGDSGYGFYIGECDYTGFDCRGSMRLYLSDKIEVLIEKAFTNEDYRVYLETTKEM